MKEGFLPRMKFMNADGLEVPDPQPLSVPAGFKIPETLEEQMKRVIRQELSAQAMEQGFETFDEAEDFDIDDLFDPTSPYEEVFDPVLGRGITAQEFRDNEEMYRARYLAAEEQSWAAWDQSEALRGRRKTPSPSPGGGSKDAPSLPPGKGGGGGSESDQ